MRQKPLSIVTIIAATIALAIIFATAATPAAAQGKSKARFAMGFYDVGNLYDTIPSQFYDDRDYTPKGALQWTEQRYKRKVRNIAAAIDSLNMPIVALYGVENREVVDDILRASKSYYSSIHTTIDFYSKGLDFALLYYADELFIEQVTNNGYTLYVAATTAAEERVSIHLSTRGYKLITAERPQDYDSHDLSIEELHAPTDITIAWGGFTRKDFERLGLEDAYTKYYKAASVNKGETYSQKYRWHFKNRIGVLTTTERETTASIFAPRWLLSRNLVQPEPTYTLGKRYRGGYSKQLPTYIIIE